MGVPKFLLHDAVQLHTCQRSCMLSVQLSRSLAARGCTFAIFSVCLLPDCLWFGFAAGGPASSLRRRSWIWSISATLVRSTPLPRPSPLPPVHPRTLYPLGAAKACFHASKARLHSSTTCFQFETMDSRCSGMCVRPSLMRSTCSMKYSRVSQPHIRCSHGCRLPCWMQRPVSH